MSTRMGVLLTFKPEVTREQAEKALAGLKGLVDEKITYPHTKPYQTRRIADYNRPERTADPAKHIETYDDNYGGPVWYIP